MIARTYLSLGLCIFLFGVCAWAQRPGFGSGFGHGSSFGHGSGFGGQSFRSNFGGQQLFRPGPSVRPFTGYGQPFRFSQPGYRTQSFRGWSGDGGQRGPGFVPRSSFFRGRGGERVLRPGFVPRSSFFTGRDRGRVFRSGSVPRSSFLASRPSRSAPVARERIFQVGPRSFASARSSNAVAGSRFSPHHGSLFFPSHSGFFFPFFPRSFFFFTPLFFDSFFFPPFFSPFFSPFFFSPFFFPRPFFSPFFFSPFVSFFPPTSTIVIANNFPSLGCPYDEFYDRYRQNPPGPETESGEPEAPPPDENAAQPGTESSDQAVAQTAESQEAPSPEIIEQESAGPSEQEREQPSRVREGLVVRSGHHSLLVTSGGAKPSDASPAPK